MYDLDIMLFDYVAHGNPKSNAHLKRYLRRYPEFREDLIEFTANWRALSIVQNVFPAPQPDPAADRDILRRAKAQLRGLMRRRSGARAV
jgi:hypothetical protein